MMLVVILATDALQPSSSFEGSSSRFYGKSGGQRPRYFTRRESYVKHPQTFSHLDDIYRDGLSPSLREIRSYFDSSYFPQRKPQTLEEGRITFGDGSLSNAIDYTG